MAVVITPYCTSTFNNLPGFEVAGPKFDAVDGKTIITDIMTPLFRKHSVEKVLGLQLLHQHFQLYSGERLVDFNGTSMPIIPEGGQVSNLTTTIWGLEHSGDRFQLQPLEFMLNSGNTNLDEASPWNDVNFQKFVASNQSFFLEYSAIVKKLGVEGLFGFARYPGDGFSGRVEVGIGRTNINLSPAQVCEHIPALA